MKDLKNALLEQKERKGNGYGTYGITAADVRENCTDELLPVADADYFIRLICRTKSGILNHSIKDAKKELFAVKNGQIFKCNYIAAHQTASGQWMWDILDDIAEKPMTDKFGNYEAACEKYHNQNPTDSRIEYDCYCWFKGTNAVIVAPNYSEVRGKFPNAAKKIIRNYSEV